MFINITYWVLIAAIIITMVRLILGPTIWDRLLSLNLINAKIVLVIIIYGVKTDNMFYIDIAITFALIGFLCIALLSKFVRTGGRHK
ncbi:MAG: pH regulation protein F [Alkaliphilus sp.]|nr:pH regulation protein F [Alkaliphilus sp. AH-315-G20]MBN4067636.1 pH regulation protein F [Alkaliphilus transvaalensis]PHS34883.1 MAG: pH regulation protein F [Alkaliphilus sp.]